MDNTQIRKEMIKKRKLLSQKEWKQLSFSIYQQIIHSSTYQQANTIGIYVSYHQEVDTIEIINHAFKHNKRVVVPKIINKEMIFVEIQSMNDLKIGILGILEPIDSTPYPKEKIDVMYTPVVAFHQLFRIGYGKGYYDSYLKDYNYLKIGLAFDFQKDKNIILHENDVSLDQIMISNNS